MKGCSRKAVLSAREQPLSSACRDRFAATRPSSVTTSAGLISVDAAQGSASTESTEPSRQPWPSAATASRGRQLRRSAVAVCCGGQGGRQLRRSAVAVSCDGQPWPSAAAASRGRLLRRPAVAVCCDGQPWPSAAAASRGRLLRRSAVAVCCGGQPWPSAAAASRGRQLRRPGWPSAAAVSRGRQLRRPAVAVSCGGPSDIANQRRTRSSVPSRILTAVRASEGPSHSRNARRADSLRPEPAPAAQSRGLGIHIPPQRPCRFPDLHTGQYRSQRLRAQAFRIRRLENAPVAQPDCRPQQSNRNRIAAIPRYLVLVRAGVRGHQPAAIIVNLAHIGSCSDSSIPAPADLRFATRGSCCYANLALQPQSAAVTPAVTPIWRYSLNQRP